MRPRWVEMLLATPEAAAVELRLFQPGEIPHAPHLLEIEVAHALLRYPRLGQRR
jgi:hypothetical protein